MTAAKVSLLARRFDPHPSGPTTPRDVALAAENWSRHFSIVAARAFRPNVMDITVAEINRYGRRPSEDIRFSLGIRSTCTPREHCARDGTRVSYGAGVVFFPPPTAVVATRIAAGPTSWLRENYLRKNTRTGCPRTIRRTRWLFLCFRGRKPERSPIVRESIFELSTGFTFVFRKRWPVPIFSL